MTYRLELNGLDDFRVRELGLGLGLGERGPGLDLATMGFDYISVNWWYRVISSTVWIPRSEVMSLLM